MNDFQPSNFCGLGLMVRVRVLLTVRVRAWVTVMVGEVGMVLGSG